MSKSKPVVLIVEDEVPLNEAYQQILEHAKKYEVLSAFNGKEALAKIADKEPAVILLDLRMPIMDGVAFLREYDLVHKHPDVNVIVFSNYDMQKEIDEAYQLGAKRYMLKAWASPKELLQIVSDTLST